MVLVVVGERVVVVVDVEVVVVSSVVVVTPVPAPVQAVRSSPRIGTKTRRHFTGGS